MRPHRLSSSPAEGRGCFVSYGSDNKLIFDEINGRHEIYYTPQRSSIMSLFSLCTKDTDIARGGGF